MQEAHPAVRRPGRAPNWLTGRRLAALLGAIVVVMAIVVVGISRTGSSRQPTGAAANPLVTTSPPAIGGPTTGPTAAPTTQLAASPSASRPAPARTTQPPAPTQHAPAPAGGQRVRAYVTGYSFFDNTPPGSATISNPVLHQRAGGTGTYADPITVAVGHVMSGGHDVLDWPAGTRFYIPNLRRYFIAEDSCGDGPTPQNGPCHTGYPGGASTWLDVWVGGDGGSRSGADACMDQITDVWDVITGPPAGYAVVSGGVYGGGGCTRQYGNQPVSA